MEGRSKRLWVGLGVAALAVTLCCGGGLAAGIGLVITGTQAVNERARAAVGGYLDDVRAGRYAEAYDALCPNLRHQESPGQFAERLADEPKIDSYELGDAQLTTVVTLPVTVHYANGGDNSLRFALEQDTGSGEFEVCGIDG